MTPSSPAIEPLRKRGRGRPKKVHTCVVNVRLTDHVYDAYIKAARRGDDDVRKIMRNVLTYYAPRS